MRLNNRFLLLLRIPALAVALTVGGTALIKLNKSPSTSIEPAPMPVWATSFQQQSGYSRTANYLGSVRASTDSLIGFEIRGLLERLPVSEGMHVELGQIIAQLNIDRLQAALSVTEATLQRVEAQLEQAESRAERISKLLEDGSSSRQSYDDARFTVKALIAAQNEATAQTRLAQLDLTKSSLKAPYAGIVAERFVQVGTVLAEGTPVLRLVTLTGREAHIGVPVHIARRLIIGGAYSVELGPTQVQTKLQSIRDDVDPATATIGAVFELPREISASVGESAVLKLEETIHTIGGWLPITALVEGSRGLWNVFILKPNDNGTIKALRESVEIVHTKGNTVFVQGALIDGTAVITSGLHRISQGDLVHPIFKQENAGN